MNTAYATLRQKFGLIAFFNVDAKHGSVGFSEAHTSAF